MRPLRATARRILPESAAADGASRWDAGAAAAVGRVRAALTPAGGGRYRGPTVKERHSFYFPSPA